MESDESTIHHEKNEQDGGSNANVSKIVDTQSIIRYKFKKACMNRLQDEHGMNQALKPFTTTNEMETKVDDFSPQYLSETSSNSRIHQPQLATKNISNHLLKSGVSGTTEKRQQNPNELCERLRQLVTLQIGGNMNHTKEINSIIKELHKQNIII